MPDDKGKTTNGRGQGRRGPRKGKEVRLTRSIRIEPSKRDMIETKYKSVQVWFDLKLDEEFGEYEDVEVVQAEEE